MNTETENLDYIKKSERKRGEEKESLQLLCFFFFLKATTYALPGPETSKKLLPGRHHPVPKNRTPNWHRHAYARPFHRIERIHRRLDPRIKNIDEERTMSLFRRGGGRVEVCRCCRRCCRRGRHGGRRCIC